MPRESIYRGGEEELPRPKKSGEPPAPTPDEKVFEEELRPRRLSQVVGQRKVLERLQIILDAAQKRGEPLGHLLLDGPPGLGKTTLAMVIPRELGVDIQFTSGPALRAPRDLLPYLTNAGKKSVLFIDEIHRLPPAVEEFIYPAMEDWRVDITLGEGLNARTISMTLERFTVIGATTRSGMLTAPLRDRFVHREHLDYYDLDELAVIVTTNARKLNAEIDAEAAAEIASRSRGTPRKANNLLRWTRDFAEVHGEQGRITNEMARRALEMREVDALGLEHQDRRYLKTLIESFSGGPAGLQTMAHSLSIPADTLEDDVEPYLLRIGFIQRTPRGRVATAAAWSHIGVLRPMNSPGGQGELFE
ncbi:MAG: Holliday junction branch migration DNA helicase RuvB [Planctomycetota bacterium]|nr:Holliday junction branch migration DNA helicase RuvB [Planctomycetaceae bacterium]MDQ3330798.1 Holliday junction branch migration DNA helicase RuvB [Planctomycetota bacterium]